MPKLIDSTDIDGVILVEPDSHGDQRGRFVETYRREWFPSGREMVQGKTVFFVDENALVACFDTGMTEEVVKELAGREPLRVVFRDNGFVSDAVKINVEQIFRQLSPGTDVRSI